jgi:hypothetical protein
VTWFQDSAEHESSVCTCSCNDADVIEASLELGWKGWKGWKAISNVHAAQVAKTVTLSIDSMVLSNWRWRRRGPHHTSQVPEVTTMNRRPLEMRSDNAAQGRSRRVQHGHLLGRFTKLRPGFNPIVRHHLSYHIIYQIYPEMTSADLKTISPNAFFLLNSSQCPISRRSAE